MTTDPLMDDAMTDDVAGFFSDLGLDDAPDNPNYVPDGKYHAFLFGVKPFKKNDNGVEKKKLIFSYKIDDPNANEYNGKKIDVWREANADDDPGTKAWLKRDLKELGVPEGRMAGLRFADIIGERVTIKVKNNGQYTNINEIKRETEGAGSANDEPDF